MRLTVKRVPMLDPCVEPSRVVGPKLESGELTPSMKVKRATVLEMYAAEIADMYRS